jgi:CheY-like chemotaxis protein
MGGDIEVESRVGEGTRFSFEVDLPVSQDVPHAEGGIRVVGLAPGEHQPTILVADDVDANRLLIRRLLGGVGFAVAEARNGAEAVRIVRERKVDLVLMDMRMPVMDGREATRRIREEESSDGTRGRIPIVALTASAFEHERDGIIELGADDFVTKPFRAERIFEVIAERLGVNYIYDERAHDAGVIAEAGLTAESLASLPSELLATLEEALLEGNFELATQVAEEIRQRNEPIGSAIAAEVRAFKLDELLSLIERVKT